MRHLLRIFALALGLLLSLAAQSLEITEENDGLVTAGDRHYTQGARLALTPIALKTPLWHAAFDRLALPFARTPATGLWLQWLPVGQQLYTADKPGTQQASHDRPYAGWLYTGAALFSVADDDYSRLELLLGIVGPSAGGEPLQNGFHHVFGLPMVNGWSGQLGDTAVAVASYERGARWSVFKAGRSRWDLLGQLGLTGGNLLDDAHAAALIRGGTLASFAYGADSLRGGYSALPRGPNADDQAGDWAIWAGVQLRDVWRNALLQGFGDGDPSVQVKTMTRSWMIGAAVALPGRCLMSFNAADVSAEFQAQQGHDRYGSITLELPF